MPANIRENNFNLFNELRKRFPVFIYQGFSKEENSDMIFIKFHYIVPGLTEFHPQMSIPKKKHNFKISINDPCLDYLLFQIGMAELPSYWKAVCSPNIIIRPYIMDTNMQQWWKEQYFKGLSEFFYRNNIETDIHSFLNFNIESNHKTEPVQFNTYDFTIVPVGGGKDSVVTLEILKKSGFPLNGFVINPRNATINTLQKAGIERNHFFEMTRNIDSNLLELNQKGFLNGHTPFSAVLAFYTILFAAITGSKYIALSNESSANESTIKNTEVNHQYSKTYAFELAFRNYIRNYVTKDIEYFSFLRPLNEMQIARLFSAMPHYHDVFRSCNAGSKDDTWCCNCPKCLFTYIILAPYLSKDKLMAIFGCDLFSNENLKDYFEQLCGIQEDKPFECVGTTNEVNLSLCLAIKNWNEPHPTLLNYYKNTEKYSLFSKIGTDFMFRNFDNNNFLPPDFLKTLKNVIN